jgi:hypothetical protein
MLARSAQRFQTAALAWIPVSFLALAAASDAARAQYGPVDPYESSLRILRDGIQSRNDGQQHAAMVALRELRDPSTRALLERFLKCDDWSLRVDSVLGLAEIDSARKIDPALIAALPRENDRELAISAVLALELADQDRVRTMLAWEDVASSQRVLLAGELRRLGGEPDRAELVKMLDSKTPEVAGLALAILLDMGAPDAEQATARVRGMIAELPPRSRSAAVAAIAEGASIDALKGAAPFVASLLALPDLAGDAQARALGSLLVLDAQHGYPVFAKAVEADRSQLSLMRHAAIMLASGARAPAAEWNRLRNGEGLIETIADAGALLAASDDAAAYGKLVALKHRVTLRAALEGARRLGNSADRALGLECLRLFEKQQRELGPLLEPVMRALARLASVAPEELKPALERAQSEPDLQDPLLIVLCAAGTPEAAAVSNIASGKASRLGEALIAVMRARTAESITPEQLQTLANVAGGAVAVDPAVRVQAAWLWLRHAKRLDGAIDALAASATAGNTDGTGGAKP